MVKQELQLLHSAYYPMFFFEPLCMLELSVKSLELLFNSL